jgi:glutathione S-transferase
VLTALPWLVPADDPVAHVLDDIARDVPEPSRAQLSAGAELRRSVDESLLDKESAKDAHQAWQNLVRLAQARARLELPKGVAAQARVRSSAVLRRLDQRISEHVSSLTTMYTAADAASAATLSLDDSALQKVDTAGASLDEVSKAIVEEAL